MLNNNFSSQILKKEGNSKNIYDYSRFKGIDDFDLDDELIEKFTPIALELGLNQESVEMLLDLALEMSKKQKNILNLDSEYRLKQDIEKYRLMTKEDSEIPDMNSAKMKEYLLVADNAYDALVSDSLKEIFVSTGLIYHPELIKMFYKIGDMMQEDGISYFGKPVIEELTPAQILYKKFPQDND